MIVYIKILIIVLFLSLINPVSGEGAPILDTLENYASWSPDGQKILFESTGFNWEGIYIVRPDGSELQEIVPYGKCPSWSPNGTKILLTKNINYDYFNGTHEIILLDVETKNITRITYNNMPKRNPKFSPDGNKIIFESEETIYIMNPDGTELKKLVDSAEFPEFSPDSKKIVYNTFEDFYEIWVINIDGTNKTKIFDDKRFKIINKYRWTNDSNYLLLNNRSNIITKVNIENTSDIEYVYDPVAPLNPKYSPDGNYVAFTSDMDGGYADLFVARSNGSDLYRIVYNTNAKRPFEPSQFRKIERPAPPSWPTTEPGATSKGRLPSIPGFSAMVAFMILILLAFNRRM